MQAILSYHSASNAYLLQWSADISKFFFFCEIFLNHFLFLSCRKYICQKYFLNNRFLGEFLNISTLPWRPRVPYHVSRARPHSGLRFESLLDFPTVSLIQVWEDEHYINNEPRRQALTRKREELLRMHWSVTQWKRRKSMNCAICTMLQEE